MRLLASLGTRIRKEHPRRDARRELELPDDILLEIARHISSLGTLLDLSLLVCLLSYFISLQESECLLQSPSVPDGCFYLPCTKQYTSVRIISAL